MIDSTGTNENCLGFVVIGRNEGERLKRCLRSIDPSLNLCVYVDSASSDDSPEVAMAMKAEVVQLDMARPFTAARARNEGFQHLLKIAPHISLVMFVDGDCEIDGGWTKVAVSFLNDRADVAVVSGRLRERFPEKTVYNQLCDNEWNTTIGLTNSCGGIAMMRVAALKEVAGFRGNLIAGEEPELCVRLRRAGWKIWRLDAEMALHDAAMTRWSQWWRRTMRSGYAFAEGAYLHGTLPERHFVKETRRALLWGCVAPLVILLLSVKLTAAWLLWLIYPLQVARLAFSFREAGKPAPWTYALFLILGRFPEAQGVLRFWGGRLRGHGSAIIEYK